MLLRAWHTICLITRPANTNNAAIQHCPGLPRPYTPFNNRCALAGSKLVRSAPSSLGGMPPLALTDYGHPLLLLRGPHTPSSSYSYFDYFFHNFTSSTPLPPSIYSSALFTCSLLQGVIPFPIPQTLLSPLFSTLDRITGGLLLCVITHNTGIIVLLASDIPPGTISPHTKISVPLPPPYPRDLSTLTVARPLPLPPFLWVGRLPGWRLVRRPSPLWYLCPPLSPPPPRTLCVRGVFTPLQCPCRRRWLPSLSSALCPVHPKL